MNEMSLDAGTQIKATARELIALVEHLERWRPKIEEALAYGGSAYTFDQVVQGCVQAKILARFWDDAFMLVQVVEYPNSRHYHIFVAGGNMQTLIAARPQIIEAARAAGCERISLSGRKGWERMFQGPNVKVQVKMSMEIDDG